MWEWLRVHGWTLETILNPSSWRNLRYGLKKDWFQVLIIAAIPLGLLSYMAYLKLTFGDPVAFSTVQSAWNRQNIGPIAVVVRDIGFIISEGFNQNNTLRMLNLVALMASVGLALPVWKRLGVGYGVYVLIMLILPAFSSSQSILRYVLVCFPIFMILGRLGNNSKIDRGITIGFATLLGVSTAIYVNWVFIA